MSNENLQRDEAAERSALISTTSYDVSLDVRQAGDPDVAGYPSRSVITFSAAQPGSSTFLDFIGDVHSVFLNGRELRVEDAVDGARIRLDNLQTRNEVTVTSLRACRLSSLILAPSTTSSTRSSRPFSNTL